MSSSVVIRVVAVLGLGAIAVAGCSSSGAAKIAGPTASPVKSTASTASGLDSCVVGTWTSTGATGTLSSPDGKVHVPLGGGAGEVVVIGPTGAVGISYNAMSPETGTGNDGGAYAVTYHGALHAILHAAHGHATLTIGNPQGATVTVTDNGRVVERSHPPASPQPSTYSCTPGGRLAVTGGGITTHYTKG